MVTTKTYKLAGQTSRSSRLSGDQKLAAFKAATGGSSSSRSTTTTPAEYDGVSQADRARIEKVNAYAATLQEAIRLQQITNRITPTQAEQIRAKYGQKGFVEQLAAQNASKSKITQIIESATAKYEKVNTAVSKKLPSVERATPVIEKVLKINPIAPGLPTAYTSLNKNNKTKKYATAIRDVNVGQYQAVKEKPVKAVTTFAVFMAGGVALKGFGAAAKAAGAGKRSTAIARAIERGAVGIYVLDSGRRVVSAKDARGFGYVTGDIIFNEVLPAGAGLKVVNKLPAAAVRLSSAQKQVKAATVNISRSLQKEVKALQAKLTKSAVKERGLTKTQLEKLQFELKAAETNVIDKRIQAIEYRRQVRDISRRFAEFERTGQITAAESRKISYPAKKATPKADKKIVSDAAKLEKKIATKAKKETGLTKKQLTELKYEVNLAKNRVLANKIKALEYRKSVRDISKRFDAYEKTGEVLPATNRKISLPAQKATPKTYKKATKKPGLSKTQLERLRFELSKAKGLYGAKRINAMKYRKQVRDINNKFAAYEKAEGTQPRESIPITMKETPKKSTKAQSERKITNAGKKLDAERKAKLDSGEYVETKRADGQVLLQKVKQKQAVALKQELKPVKKIKQVQKQAQKKKTATKTRQAAKTKLAQKQRTATAAKQSQVMRTAQVFRPKQKTTQAVAPIQKQTQMQTVSQVPIQTQRPLQAQKPRQAQAQKPRTRQTVKQTVKQAQKPKQKQAQRPRQAQKPKQKTAAKMLIKEVPPVLPAGMLGRTKPGKKKVKKIRAGAKQRNKNAVNTFSKIMRG